MPISNPDFNDFEDFDKSVSALRTFTTMNSLDNLSSIRGLLAPIDPRFNPEKILYDENKATELMEHKIRKWLSENSLYVNALKSFKRTKGFKKYKIGEAELFGELEFMRNCSLHMIWYLTYSKKHPPKVVTNAMRKKALKPLDILLDLISDGLTLPDPLETYKFRSLINKLKISIKNNEPSLSAKKEKGYLRERYFVQNISQHFKNVYGEYLETVISHLLDSMGARNISRSTIEGWIKDVRDYRRYYKENK